MRSLCGVNDIEDVHSVGKQKHWSVDGAHVVKREVSSYNVAAVSITFRVDAVPSQVILSHIIPIKQQYWDIICCLLINFNFFSRTETPKLNNFAVER